MSEAPEGSTESQASNLRPLVLQGHWIIHYTTAASVRLKEQLFVSFPCVVASTGPGGFMVCVCILLREHPKLCAKTTTSFCSFSMGSNQYWVGRVYRLCVH